MLVMGDGRWVFSLTVVLSILVHGVALLPRDRSAPLRILQSDLVRVATPRVEGTWKLVEPASPQHVAAARQKLVAEARTARARGTLKLGAFLLRAADIDAAELGIALDIQEAERRYRVGLETFRAGMKGRNMMSALHTAYGGMHYHSIGGNIADALLEGGGSCEQLTHLVVATLYDGGLADYAFVRYYGGDTPHLAPIYAYRQYSFDLVLRGEALPGGIQFPAADLIEVYARKHGLADGAVDTGKPPRWSDGRSTFAGGYPPNNDAFRGVVPLFAEDAFGGSATQVAGSGGGDDAMVDKDCPLDWWDRLGRSNVAILSADEDPYTVELIDIHPWSAVQLSSGIARWEAGEDPKASRVERVIHHACLAMAYERLAVDLAALGKPALTKTAQRRSLASRKMVEELATPAFTQAEEKELVKREDAWLLVTLPEPAALVDDIFEDGPLPTSQLLWALIENDKSRDAALDQLSRQPFIDRFMAMMALSFDRETRWQDPVPPDSDLGRARRAFWELQQSHEKLKFDDEDSFVNALAAHGFPPAWTADLRRLQRRSEELKQAQPNLPPLELLRQLREL